MSYTWKEFDIHKKNYTFEELDRALRMAVDTKIAWEMDRDSPTLRLEIQKMLYKLEERKKKLVSTCQGS
jgi:hypothetical protein